MGRAMALAFARAGADISVGSLLADKGVAKVGGELSYLPGQDELQATREEIEGLGVRCLALGLDVTETESVQAFCNTTIAELGKVDILANAAGITAEHAISGHSEALWRKVMSVNVDGAFRTIRLALPGMIERRWGRIINVASTAASVGAATSGAYCASKAALVGLSRCVALEGAPYGVTCNAISPGWTDTNFGRDWMSDIAVVQEKRCGEEDIAAAEQANPQGRLMQVGEVAALALYLCREEALAMTMQDLTLSGGSLW